MIAFDVILDDKYKAELLDAEIEKTLKEDYEEEKYRFYALPLILDIQELIPPLYQMEQDNNDRLRGSELSRELVDDVFQKTSLYSMVRDDLSYAIESITLEQKIRKDGIGKLPFAKQRLMKLISDVKKGGHQKEHKYFVDMIKTITTAIRKNDRRLKEKFVYNPSTGISHYGKYLIDLRKKLRT